MFRAVAVLALVVTTTVSSSQPPTPAPTETHHRAERSANDSGAKPDGKSNAANPFAGSHAVSGKVDCPHCERRANSDGASSQWWFNLLLVIFTGALAVFAFFQLRAMSGQLAEMKTTGTDTHDLAQAAKDGAAAMLRQLEAYERPWVTASLEARSGLYFDNAGLVVTFGVLLRNIGRSIATHISYDIEIVPASAIGDDYARVLAKQEVISKRLEPQASGYVLFAGDDIPTIAQRRLDSDSIRRNAGTVDGEEYVTLCLAVVITYRYPTSDRSHATRLAFIFGNIIEPIEDLLFVKLAQTLPREKLTVLRLTSGNYAD